MSVGEIVTHQQLLYILAYSVVVAEQPVHMSQYQVKENEMVWECNMHGEKMNG